MPTSEVIVSLGGTMITLLGGGSVVLVAICGYVAKLVADHSLERQKADLNSELERHKASLSAELERVRSELSRETDSHRLKLRKAEILFDRELQAVSEFSTLYRQIRPEYSRPDMEWDDACEIVAGRFSEIERMLEDYLMKNAPVLTEELRDALRRCVTYAAHNKFGAYQTPEDQADDIERAAAGELLDALKNVEVGLFELVRNEARS